MDNLKANAVTGQAGKYGLDAIRKKNGKPATITVV